MKTTTWLLPLALAGLIAGCGDDRADTDAQGGTQDAASDAGLVDATTDALPDAAPPPLITVEAALDAVDPFIGTGGIAFAYAALTPAAQVPNGLVRLGPDTTYQGSHPDFHHFSGYHFDDPAVRGFSHLHFVGTGAPDYGNLRVLPTDDLSHIDAGWVLMDKASETASPGRYGVRLTEPEVQVELTATRLAGMHRYTFAPDVTEGALRHLLLNAAASVTDRGASDVQIRVDGDTIEGQVTYAGSLTGRKNPFTLFFSVTADPPPDDAFIWDAAGLQPGQTATGPEDIEGQEPAAGVILTYAPGQQVELRVGVSFIDLDTARDRRVEDLDGRTFEEVAAAARAKWQAKIERLRVGGGTETDRRILYTALYHAYMMPSRIDEADGQYRGLDGEVHHTDHPYYTDLSLWDTFRTLHPFYELFDPDVERDVLRSLLAMYRDSGRVPRWPAAWGESGSMCGSSADLLFAGGALKGIDGIDYDAALDALIDSAQPHLTRPGFDDYVTYGYLPVDLHRDDSVSITLEYALDDWGLANLAAHLGRPEAESLRARSDSWRHLFDPSTGFMEPRQADGTFVPVNSHEQINMAGGPFVEGSAWHWRFYAPHDPAGLADAFGGAEPFGAALDRFFTLSGLDEGRLIVQRPDPYYWHGNEPDLHVPFLAYEAGQPTLVADWTRAIQSKLYHDAPVGMPGNDDGGTMSSWYLFTAGLGLYPIAGGDEYYLTAPRFPRVLVELPSGPLEILAPGADDATRYVLNVTLGDRDIQGHRVTHADLLTSGSLKFTLSAVAGSQ